MKEDALLALIYPFALTCVTIILFLLTAHIQIPCHYIEMVDFNTRVVHMGMCDFY
jgi:hypothetical protein